MTYVSTPTPGAVPQERRSRKPSMKLAAVVLTVVVGGAIAYGTSTVNDVATQAIPAVSDNPELLKLDKTSADVAHPSGRKTPRWVPGGEVITSEMTNAQFTQFLIDIGRLPQGAIPTGTQPVDTGGSGPR